MYNISIEKDVVRVHRIVEKLKSIITERAINLIFFRREAISPRRPVEYLTTTAVIPLMIISHLDLETWWPRLVANWTWIK